MQFFNQKDRLLLVALSRDSRSPITKLSKAIGYSRITTIKTLDKLQKNLDIKFTLEINEYELQKFERHVIAIKLSKKPNIKILEGIFAKDNYAQNVYLTDGGFDLLIYAATLRGTDYIVWETHLAEMLSEYGPIMRTSEYVTSHFGYMPLNSAFIEILSRAYKIDDKDKSLLKLINKNARISYSELSRLTGIGEDTVRYRLFTLKKKGIIKRFTIAVQKPPENSVSIAYFINYRFNRDTTSRGFPAVKSHFFNSDKDNPILNSFQLIAPISGTYRSFGVTLFPNDKEALENTIEKQRDIFKEENIEITYAFIKRVLKGLLPFRNLDIKENYNTITWHEPNL